MERREPTIDARCRLAKIRDRAVLLTKGGRLLLVRYERPISLVPT